jgi:hypothetical protein
MTLVLGALCGVETVTLVKVSMCVECCIVFKRDLLFVVFHDLCVCVFVCVCICAYVLYPPR